MQLHGYGILELLAVPFGFIMVTKEMSTPSSSSPMGRDFGTGSDDSTCQFYDMRTGHQLQVYSQQHDADDNDVPIVMAIAFSLSGRLLFAGYSSGDCYVWDTLVGEVVLNLGTLQNSHESCVSCLGLSSGGSALCTGSWDKNLKVNLLQPILYTVGMFKILEHKQLHILIADDKVFSNSDDLSPHFFLLPTFVAHSDLT